jgi:hypothetical protein
MEGRRDKAAFFFARCDSQSEVAAKFVGINFHRTQ